MERICRAIVMVLLVFVAYPLCAQTPVEELILKYEGADGARSFNARGLSMVLARRLISSTPLAPVASDVTVVAVLKMADVQPSVQKHFVADLDNVLDEGYKYYGKYPSKNGEVEVYVSYSGPQTVDELVVYNPAIYSLNSLYGKFTSESLMKIAKGTK